MMSGPARTLASAARTAYSVAASGARHAAWYVRYQVDGNARARDQAPRPRRSSDRS